MAYVKIIPVRTRLDRCVNYIQNGDKTSLSNAMDYMFDKSKTSYKHVVYEDAINCRPHKAHEDMMATKRKFSKKNGVLGYHIIHSFKPGEVSPTLAHKIGVQYANECFGDKYECVIGTHIDKNHIHNHIAINSVSFIDGKKYRNNFQNYYGDMRGISNRICKTHGLSVITPSETDKSLTYVEWLARNKGKMSWQSLIRLDIDDAVNQAFNYGNFLVLMQNKGYTIKQGKYLAFKPYEKKRFNRAYKLGDWYDEKSLKAKIDGKNLTKELTVYKKVQYVKRKYYKKGKAKGFQALVLHYMYLLGSIKKNEAPERVSILLKEDLLKFDEIKKLYDFLKDRNLDSLKDVLDYNSKCEQKIQKLKDIQQELTKTIKDKRHIYDALKDLCVYEKPYRLYLDGYLSMKEEHDSYLNARAVFNDAEYVRESELASLETEYCKYLDSLAKTRDDISHFHHEIRKCDMAISTEQHIKIRIKIVNRLDKHNEMRIKKIIDK